MSHAEDTHRQVWLRCFCCSIEGSNGTQKSSLSPRYPFHYKMVMRTAYRASSSTGNRTERTVGAQREQHSCQLPAKSRAQNRPRLLVWVLVLPGTPSPGAPFLQAKGLHKGKAKGVQSQHHTPVTDQLISCSCATPGPREAHLRAAHIPCSRAGGQRGTARTWGSSVSSGAIPASARPGPGRGPTSPDKPHGSLSPRLPARTAPAPLPAPAHRVAARAGFHLPRGKPRGDECGTLP